MVAAFSVRGRYLRGNPVYGAGTTVGASTTSVAFSTTAVVAVVAFSVVIVGRAGDSAGATMVAVGITASVG